MSSNDTRSYDELDLAADLARRDLYLFISIATMPPGDRAFRAIEDATFRTIVGGALGLIQEDPLFHPASLGPGEILPSQASRDFLFEPLGSLADEYVFLFGHTASKDCPPYETEYCPNRDITYRSQQMADIAGFYRAFGLERSREAHERVDHVSLEAEFMSVVVTRSIHAARENLGLERLQVCRDAQRSFFKEHLGWWLPAFGTILSRRAATGFYAGFGNLLRAFVPAERAFFGLPPFTELATATTATSGTEEACHERTLPL